MEIILDGKYKADASVVALGMFDGVHIGHQVLLKKAVALAKAAKAPLVACTFVNHPMTLIAPEKAPPLLSTFDERARLLEAMGVDVLYALPFDRAMMNQPPECYVGELVRRFHPTDVVCGYNHSFGQKGGGTPALLEVLGGALGFCTSVVPKITLGGLDVSSTAIRDRLAKGDVKGARALLGRPYSRRAAAEPLGKGLCRLTLTPDGKQDVGEGRYRALLETAQKRLPVTLKVDREGQTLCSPAACMGESGVRHTILYIA